MELILRISIIVIGLFGLILLATGSLKRKPNIQFLIYFTNLSNIFVFLYYLLNLNNKYFHFLSTIYIVYTMFVFNFVIIPYLRKNKHTIRDLGVNTFTSTIVHVIVPLLAVFHWFKYSVNVTYIDILLVYIFPAAYLAFAICLGKSKYKIKDNITNYIYPFLDLEKLGVGKVILNGIYLFLFLTALSAGLIYLR